MHGQTTLKLPVSIPLSCSEQITTYSTCGRERSNARSIRHWLRQFKEGGGREKKNMDSRKGSRTLLYTLNHDRKCVAGVQNSQGAYHQNYDVQTSRIYKYYFEGTLEKRIFSKLWNNVFSDKTFLKLMATVIVRLGKLLDLLGFFVNGLHRTEFEWRKIVPQLRQSRVHVPARGKHARN